VKEVFKNIPEGKSFVGKPRNRQLDDAENYLKGTGVRGCTKIARDTRRQVIDREGGQSPTWTAQPALKKNKTKKTKEKETGNNRSIKGTQQ
jgi:hypothetical protein